MTTLKQKIFSIDKPFYKMVFAIVLPIMIQNLVNTLVNSIPVIPKLLTQA
ncbi:MAG: hypothetical protein ACI4TF_01630 [Oliverpabstia sp.]